MTRVFRDLYAAELEYLYGHAAELAREQSRIAPMLGRDADAGVSRLAQTVAFLSARLRQRLADDLPDLVHPVLESLRPWLLRPLPSATIVEIVPAPAMKESQNVRAGSVFGSKPVDGGPACTFRSTIDLHVRPLSLDGIAIGSERTEVRLKLSVRGDALLGSSAEPLRLFFAMPLAAALELRTSLLRTTTSVVARAVGTDAEVTLASAGEPLVAAPLGPSPEGDDALFALRAYFAWPEQFAFVDLPNADRLGALGAKTRAFEIVITLAKPLSKALAVDASVVRLNCVPAVNVRSAPTTNAPLVRGRCAIELGDLDLYAIERVTLINDDLSTRLAVPYAGFFPPPVGADGQLSLLYRVERVPSVSGSELEIVLAFVDLARDRARLAASSVDVTALVTDGERALRVGVGELCVPTPASPPLVSFRNITPVTRSASPAFEGDRLWRWLALLKTTLWELLERESLAQVLALVNVAAWERWPESKPGADAFEALVAVRKTRLTRPGRDEIFPGARVDLDLREDLFAGPGDIDLFGECLARVFASALREHEWFEMTVRDERGEPLYEYAARFGTRRDL